MAGTWWRRLPAAATAVAGLALLVAGGLSANQRTVSALTNCDVASYSLDTQESQFVTLLNNYRSQNGLPTLAVNTTLNRAATWLVEDMGANNYFGHIDSLDRSSYQRVVDCGYPTGAGENIAAGTNWDTAQAVFDAWKASSGHNANMLGSMYTEVGVARANAPGSTYGWYWATDFGAASTGGTQPTNTPTRTPTNAPTATRTPTATPTSGGGTVPTATATPTRTPTPPTLPATATPTKTATPTPMKTATPTATKTPAGTKSPTPTKTAIATQTATKTPTRTPMPKASPSAPPSSLPLNPGANLVAWPGSDVPPAQASPPPGVASSTLGSATRWRGMPNVPANRSRPSPRRGVGDRE
jgi:uncharacterized protein YkwD